MLSWPVCFVLPDVQMELASAPRCFSRDASYDLMLMSWLCWPTGVLCVAFVFFSSRGLFLCAECVVCTNDCVGCGKGNVSLYRPWRPLGLPEVEAPTFADIRLIDGGKVVSPTRRWLFIPRKIPATHC
jgi:hypothetical protein